MAQRFEKLQLVKQRLLLPTGQVPDFITPQEHKDGYPVYFVDEDLTRIMIFSKEFEYPGFEQDLALLTIDGVVRHAVSNQSKEFIEAYNRAEDGIIILFKDDDGDPETAYGNQVTLTID